jgi:hypothetical protein
MITNAHGVGFQLEEVDVAEGRVQITGTWSGVRGLRFVRPTLIVDGREVLADLEHKPWAAGDGEAWTAAFPWNGDELSVEDAVLAVAPSIVVPLSGSTHRPRQTMRRLATEIRVRDEAEAARRRGRLLERELEALRDHNRETEERARALTADVEAGGRQLDEARERIGCLEQELADATEAMRTAASERAVMADQLEELRRQASAAERDAEVAAAARDAALAARNAARTERDAARSELDAIPVVTRPVIPPRLPVSAASAPDETRRMEIRELHARSQLFAGGGEPRPFGQSMLPLLVGAAALCVLVAAALIAGLL